MDVCKPPRFVSEYANYCIKQIKTAGVQYNGSIFMIGKAVRDCKMGFINPHEALVSIGKEFESFRKYHHKQLKRKENQPL